MELALLSVLGFFVGVIGGFLGVGGGFLYVPLLHYLGGLSVVDSVGSSLVAVWMNALSSAVGHIWRGRFDWPLGVVLGLSAIPGSLLGSLLTGVVSGRVVGWLFALSLVAVGVAMILGFGRFGGGGRIRSRGLNLLLVTVGGFSAGLASGFLGIGGGVVQVPLLVCLGVPVHVAVGTSCLAMIFMTAAGVLVHVSLGHVNLALALAMGVGGAIGGQVGSALSGKISGVWLRRIFGVLLCCVGVHMVVG